MTERIRLFIEDSEVKFQVKIRIYHFAINRRGERMAMLFQAWAVVWPRSQQKYNWVILTKCFAAL